nr:uncharacterized protein LOC125421424 [Ziziphus jujuba var. spinosa]
MAASMKTTSSVNLKLVIDSRGQRVLFAETGKDFVDFLSTLMSLPVGTVKETLLNPKAPAFNGENPIPLLLPNNNIGHEHAGKNMYVCSYISTYKHPYGGSGHLYVAHDSEAICPQCKNRMSVAVNNVVGGKKIGENELHATSSSSSSSSSSCGSGEGGFVKDVVTYLVMDDLEVSPMSTISSIAILNKFNVKEVDTLKEKMVSIGMNEGLKLLKASLQSKTVLTDVFLEKKATIEI